MKAIPFAGIEYWLNSQPLEISKLRGKIVLLDFWTYSCINCIRSIPHLTQIWEKYKKLPFVLIGIHTPEFAFEKNRDNVKMAVSKYKISYPVALDTENVTWKLYGNRYWPKQVLISADGEIVYGHIGEGGYEEIEKNIVEQLHKIGANVRIKRESRFKHIFHLHKQPHISPETYAGTQRGSIASPMVRGLDPSHMAYKDPGEHEPDSIYLEGRWDQENQYVIHRGEKGYALYQFTAKSVYTVLDSEKNVECDITIDGHSLNKYNAGGDIVFEKEKSKIVVDRPDMYNIFRAEKIEQHEIKIETEGELKLFVFTFG